MESRQSVCWTVKYLPKPTAEIFQDLFAMVPFVHSSAQTDREHVMDEDVVSESPYEEVHFVTWEELEEVKKSQEELAKGQEKILKDNAEIKTPLQILISRIPPS